VGNLSADPGAKRLLDRFGREPGLEIRNPVPRSHVTALLDEADVLVQPSENENFGFSVAEAVAAGRPVVVGPSNGTADYVGDAGFRFERYEAASVAAALIRAHDAVLTQGEALSELARRAAREHFEPERVASRLIEIARSTTKHSSRG
jgi:glycosyltransferase involved in cell wall biosynthesis